MLDHVPVYLTYSGRNCEAVLQTMEALLRGGYGLACECMLPYCKDPAAQTKRMIEMVAKDGFVVAVITDDAADCEYLRRDLQWALDAKAKMLTIVVENAALPVLLEGCRVCRVSEFPTESEMSAVMAAADMLKK